MANDKLIFKPATRQSITTIEPNNNSVAILDDRVFEFSNGTNLVLNAIESIDTGIITGTVNIDLVLSALEAVDSSNITAENLITAYLEESENLDAVLFEAKAILTASLTETDNIDTAEISSVNIVSTTLEVTDINDIVNIEAFSGVDRNAEILIIENADSSDIRVIHKSDAPDITYVPLSRVPIFRYPNQLNAALTVTENSDSCKIEAQTGDRNQIVSIKESGDGVRINSHIITEAEISMSEKQDGFSPVNVDEFIKEVNFKNDQYEKSEFELFRMVA